MNCCRSNVGCAQTLYFLLSPPGTGTRLLSEDTHSSLHLYMVQCMYIHVYVSYVTIYKFSIYMYLYVTVDTFLYVIIYMCLHLHLHLHVAVQGCVQSYYTCMILAQSTCCAAVFCIILLSSYVHSSYMNLLVYTTMYIATCIYLDI